MKTFAFIFLIAVCYVQCRKVVSVDKNAVTNFLNMEGGGGARPAQPSLGLAQNQPSNTAQNQPSNTAQNQPSKPAQNQPSKPPSSPTGNLPPPAPVTTKPVQPTTAKPAPPPQQPAQIRPKPVNPPPAANPITTPGPGSVKQLITFYDSRGNASPIRPYTYSQAVKQG